MAERDSTGFPGKPHPCHKALCQQHSLTRECQGCGSQVHHCSPQRGEGDQHQDTKAKEHWRLEQSTPSAGRLPPVFTTRGQGAWCHLDPGQGKEVNSGAQNFPEVIKGSWMPMGRRRSPGTAGMGSCPVRYSCCLTESQPGLGWEGP